MVEGERDLERRDLGEGERDERCLLRNGDSACLPLEGEGDLECFLDFSGDLLLLECFGEPLTSYLARLDGDGDLDRLLVLFI